MQSKKIFGGLQLMKATLSKKVNNLKSQYLFIYTSIPFDIDLHLIMMKGAYLYLNICILCIPCMEYIFLKYLEV